MYRKLCLGLSLLFPLAAQTAFAQAGPWQDGELIVRSVVSVSNQAEVIYRIDPLTGHGTPILTDFVPTGFSGNMAFDSYRNAFLVSAYIAPDNYQNGKLWQVFADGSKLATPNTTGIEFRCLAPVGDGRIYFQDHTFTPPQGTPKPIKYLDATNNIHTLMNVQGSAPFAADYEHLLYHKPTNSLFGTNTGWWFLNPCTPGMNAIFKIPLSADGSKVAGPVTCTSYSSSGDEIMSMDQLASGKILISIASGAFFSGAKLITLDPNTLAIAPWATPQVFDTNGGYFVPQLGKVALLDDGANVIRLFSQGATGTGSILACDVPVSPGTSGYGPGETMWKVDTSGATCNGVAFQYGTGLAGTGGLVPVLSLSGCPAVNSSFTISIDKALGGTKGILFLGYTQTSIPFLGGSFLISPIAGTYGLYLGGTPGAAGEGNLAFPVLFTDPSLSGFTFVLQAGFADAGAVQGASLTNGLQITIG